MKRVIRKYKQIAVAIDKDIKVKKTASEWYCIPLEKTIFVPQLETEIWQRVLKNHKAIGNKFEFFPFRFIKEV